MSRVCYGAVVSGYPRVVTSACGIATASWTRCLGLVDCDDCNSALASDEQVAQDAAARRQEGA